MSKPVAWGIANTRPTENNPLMQVMLYEPLPSHLVIPLYTHPAKQLSDGRIEEIIRKHWNKEYGNRNMMTFAKAIIKEITE